MISHLLVLLSSDQPRFRRSVATCVAATLDREGLVKRWLGGRRSRVEPVAVVMERSRGWNWLSTFLA